VENANDAIWVAQDGVLKFSNPRTSVLSGLSQEELGKFPFDSFLHPDDREMVLERHQRRLGGEEIPPIYSVRIINKAGEELWV
jgi:PAS domain S-box-containing protein